MRILVVGTGAREHALAWKLAAEPDVDTVVCAPGNPGTAHIAHTAALDAADPDAVLALADRERIDLTVIGPELPLDRGVVDRFAAEGRTIFGPTRAAAQLECSKVFAKAFMARHGIPTARYRACDDARTAHAIVDAGELGVPIVVKADGLAAGKGVVVAADAREAHAAIASAMEDGAFGTAGARVVLEECLSGPEVSFFAICDGRSALPLTSAQDHKRAFDDDRGPNTGGMGAFAPSPLVDAAMHARIMDGIIRPVLRGMREEGHEYRGFLYAGLMLTCDGPKVIEFNVRLGDPETQVVLPLVDGPLAPALLAAARGDLGGITVPFRDGEVRVGVVLASAGYPGPIETGKPIDGLDAAAAMPGVLVFHAGTAIRENRIVTAGGRVLTVVGAGDSYSRAIDRAYAAVDRISYEGKQYRRDIGARAVVGDRS